MYCIECDIPYVLPYAINLKTDVLASPTKYLGLPQTQTQLFFFTLIK